MYKKALIAALISCMTVSAAGCQMNSTKTDIIPDSNRGHKRSSDRRTRRRRILGRARGSCKRRIHQAAAPGQF